MLIPESEISIGKFVFRGVHEVTITKSMFSIADKAVIKLPAVARVTQNGHTADEDEPTAGKFSDGDHVVIELGYNGNLKTEFLGFVTGRSSGSPAVVHCEGYHRLLAKAAVDINAAKITVKELLDTVAAAIEDSRQMTIACGVDITLSNVRIKGTGADVIQAISDYTDGNLLCFFPEPDVLWCGLAWTQIAEGQTPWLKERTNYKHGFNIISNTLKTKPQPEKPKGVLYNKVSPSGGMAAGFQQVYKAWQTHARTLNHIAIPGVLRELANEKAYRFNYSGLEGSMTTFLEPYVSAGYTAKLAADAGDASPTGDYVVETVETSFGRAGCRRKVSMGPKVGFKKDIK